MSTSLESPECPEKVLFFKGSPEAPKKCGISSRRSGIFHFCRKFEREIKNFENFGILSNGSTEKVLNFSVEKVLNFLEMY